MYVQAYIVPSVLCQPITIISPVSFLNKRQIQVANQNYNMEPAHSNKVCQDQKLDKNTISTIDTLYIIMPCHCLDF